MFAKLYMMFGNVQMCKQLFVCMKQNQSFTISQLIDTHLSWIRTVTATQVLKLALIRQAQVKMPVSGKTCDCR